MSRVWKDFTCPGAVVITLLCGLLLAHPSGVEAGTNEIVVDTASQGLVGGGAFSLTISHTVNPGANRILIVGVAYPYSRPSRHSRGSNRESRAFHDPLDSRLRGNDGIARNGLL